MIDRIIHIFEGNSFTIILLIIILNVIPILSWEVKDLQAKPPQMTHLVRSGDVLHCEYGGDGWNCGPVSMHMW